MKLFKTFGKNEVHTVRTGMLDFIPVVSPTLRAHKPASKSQECFKINEILKMFCGLFSLAVVESVEFMFSNTSNKQEVRNSTFWTSSGH